MDLEGGLEVFLSNPGMVEKLEQSVMNWHTQITIVIEEQKRKKPQVCEIMMKLIMMKLFLCCDFQLSRLVIGKLNRTFNN